MMNCIRWLRASCLVTLLFGASSSEAQLRLFSPIPAGGEDVRVWAHMFPGDPAEEYRDLGWISPQSSHTIPDWDPSAAGSVYFSYNPGVVDWTGFEAAIDMTQAEYDVAGHNGMRTPTLYLVWKFPLPNQYGPKVYHFIGQVRVHNFTDVQQSINFNSGAPANPFPWGLVTIEPGANYNSSVLFDSTATTHASNVWQPDGLKPWMNSPGEHDPVIWIWWEFELTNSRCTHELWNGLDEQPPAEHNWCYTEQEIRDENNVILETVTWGAGCLGEPGGGGGEPGGEGNHTECCNEEELETLIALAVSRNEVLELLLECCEDGHIKIDQLAATNTAGFNTIKLAIEELVEDLNATRAQLAGEAQAAENERNATLGQQQGANDEQVGVMGALVLPFLALDDNVVAEPPAGAMEFDWGGAAWAGMGPTSVSFDFRTLPGGVSVARWCYNTILIVLILIWVREVWNMMVYLSDQVQAQRQTTTSNQIAMGANLNYVMVAANSAVVLSAFGVFLGGVIGSFLLLPCLGDLVTAFGDIWGLTQNTPALWAVVWTSGQFIPWHCAFALLTTFFMIKVSMGTLALGCRGIIRLAVA